MLPFAHSNRSNDRFNPVSSIIRRSNRTKAAHTELPYNKSHSYRYTDEPTSFRQQIRPLHEQVMESDFKNIVVPLIVPLEQPSFQRNGSLMNDVGAYYQTPMPYAPPRSPLLDQVLTETRLGADDCYNPRRKRSSKLVSIRKYLLIVMGLMALGVFLYQTSIFTQSEQGAFKLKTIKEDKLHNTPSTPVEPLPTAETLVNALPTEREPMKPAQRQYEKRLPIMKNASEKIIEPPLFEETVSEILAEKVLETLVIYSINEDYETTVEVIRG